MPSLSCVPGLPALRDAIATYLRDDPAMQFDTPVFVTAIDLLHWRPVGERGAPPPGTRPEYDPGEANDGLRFEVCWQFRSLAHRHRLRVKVAVKETDARVPSLLSTMGPLARVAPPGLLIVRITASEVEAEIARGHADFVLLGPGFNSPGVTRIEFPQRVRRQFPFVTLTSMVAPSPPTEAVPPPAPPEETR